MFSQPNLNCNPHGWRSGPSACLKFFGLLALFSLLPVVGHAQDPNEIEGSRWAASQSIPAASKGHPSMPHPHGKRIKKYDMNAIGSRGVGSGLNFYSAEAEREMGEELAQDVDNRLDVFDDQEATEYVDHIAQRLSRNSDAAFLFKVKLYTSEEVNAFSLPGGHLYVSTGLILAADNEAQLAGVIAHEIGHVAARHATRQESKSILYSILSIPASLIGGPAGYMLQAITYSKPFLLEGFSRKQSRRQTLSDWNTSTPAATIHRNL